MASKKPNQRRKTRSLKTGQIWDLRQAIAVAVHEIDRELVTILQNCETQGVSDEFRDAMTRGVRNQRANYVKLGEILEAADGVSVRESITEE